MIFPKDFFNEEVREGFTVPQMMKRAWSAQMEVLQVVDEVCSKHNILYYAAFGTLLGTIRHKGFIPWDDDIDICMLRDDYDRFLSIAPEALPEGFVLSGIYGANSRLWEANLEPQARVIADETYFQLPKYMNRFHAYPYPRIGVDIFPMDYLPDSPKEQLKLVEAITDLQYTVKYWNDLKESNDLISRLARHRSTYGINFKKKDDSHKKHLILLKIEEIVKSVNRNNSSRVYSVLYLNVPKNKESFKGYSSYDPAWFGEGINMPYENIQIRVPNEYEKILTMTYGSGYMTPKPFCGLHNYPFYKTQEKAFENLLLESGISTPVDEFCNNWHNMIGGT